MRLNCRIFAPALNSGWPQLIEHGLRTQSYASLPRFPKVVQDITLKVAADLSYAELYEFVSKEVGANAIDETHIQLEPLDIFQLPDDRGHKQITFRLTTASFERTLTDTKVPKILDQIAEAAKETLNAERV